MIQINLTEDEYTMLHHRISKDPEMIFILQKLEDAHEVYHVGYITRQVNDRVLLEDFVMAMEGDNSSFALQSLFLKVKDHLKA